MFQLHERAARNKHARHPTRIVRREMGRPNPQGRQETSCAANEPADHDPTISLKTRAELGGQEWQTLNIDFTRRCRRPPMQTCR